MEVLVADAAAIKVILNENPFKTQERKNQYFTFLKAAPDSKMIDNLVAADYPNAQFLITDKCVYLNRLKGAAKAKLYWGKIKGYCYNEKREYSK